MLPDPDLVPDQFACRLPAPAYLDKLNPEQRQAVEHLGGPLLVIAGAGSGKTNTLAHRVAHLIVNGADPRRILLMTFSRRAAARCSAASSDRGAGAGRECRRRRRALSWAGTFHAIGARLLREHAEPIGLTRASRSMIARIRPT